MTANSELRDKAIRYAHSLEKYKNGEVRRILGLLNKDVYPVLLEELQARLSKVKQQKYDKGVETTRRLQEMMASLESIIEEGMKVANRQTSKDMDQFAKVAAKATGQQIEDSITIEFETRLPSTAQLKAIVTSKPFNGAILNDYFSGLSRSAKTKLRRDLNIGLVAGETVDQITARVRSSSGALDQSRREVQAVVRTAANHVSSASRDLVFQENKDIVKGVQWVSTLDTRTTDICIDRDGEVYPIDEGPRPPAHYGCRSTITPVLKSWKEMGLDVEEVKGTRASMSGEVPEALTYKEWIKGQPPEVQDEALGTKRAALLREGANIDKFFDDQSEFLTIDQLKERLDVDVDTADDAEDTPPLEPKDAEIAALKAEVEALKAQASVEQRDLTADEQRLVQQIEDLKAQANEADARAIQAEEDLQSAYELEGLSVDELLEKLRTSEGPESRAIRSRLRKLGHTGGP